eukprot:CAMPEP_0183408702 /NCGR_PEP_ID=MMETSP0370-20130417/18279_1 /TAXON_ID=268820 /ORGANISM="Peridinium aciculiferum, Strain PAER-2" /LENGTH=244 /DNA_ID=CAMNT_0025591259 /DNA_START=25 /DNA_END=755 /DNA_ORIENTATION=-
MARTLIHCRHMEDKAWPPHGPLSAGVPAAADKHQAGSVAREGDVRQRCLGGHRGAGEIDGGRLLVLGRNLLARRRARHHGLVLGLGVRLHELGELCEVPSEVPATLAGTAVAPDGGQAGVEGQRGEERLARRRLEEQARRLADPRRDWEPCHLLSERHAVPAGGGRGGGDELGLLRRLRWLRRLRRLQVQPWPLERLRHRVAASSPMQGGLQHAAAVQRHALEQGVARGRGGAAAEVGGSAHDV